MLFSLTFYYWGEKDHIFIMLACILVNYLAGILIEHSEKLSLKKLYLAIAIVGSIGLLGYCKYFNFFVDTTVNLFNLDLDDIKKVALPLGISFYTFHALSYVIDVYRKKVQSEKNIITFICYVSLFPQLVAGPIVRYKDIRHSLYKRFITRTGFRNGILRFCFGLGKKVLIANTVAVVADHVFTMHPASLDTGLAWLGATAYMLQIYFDFSGYSDMAIGIGLMLGFKYKENFRFPYKSLSIQEFWRRWHISLSSWFRDYVYIPLGGSKKSELRTYGNLIVVFVLCGFWHGANYTFIVWGLYHGVFLILERTRIGRQLTKLPNILRHIYVLLVVLIGWVFFREENLSDALLFIKTMLVPTNFKVATIVANLNIFIVLAYIFGTVLSLGMNSYIKNYLSAQRRQMLINYYQNNTVIAGVVVLLLCILPLSSNSYNPFLYFRF